MKIKIFISLFFICFIISCKGDENSQIAELKNPILYEITGNNLEKPSYLFGTLHLIPKDDFSVPEIVNEILVASDVLVLEIDIDIPLKEQIALAQKMILPDNQTLKDILPQNEYEYLLALMTDSLGMGEVKVEKYMHLKPFFLVGVILQEYLGRIENYETYFSNLAKKNNIELIALETIDFQINLLDTISVEMQFESYLGDDLFGEYKKLLDLYLMGDLDQLYRFISEEDDYKEMEEKLINLRNVNWMPKITELITEKSAFIAVGAGHLPGDKGLINLLEKEGYEVERIFAKELVAD